MSGVENNSIAYGPIPYLYYFVKGIGAFDEKPEKNENPGETCLFEFENILNLACTCRGGSLVYKAEIDMSAPWRYERNRYIAQKIDVDLSSCRRIEHFIEDIWTAMSRYVINQHYWWKSLSFQTNKIQDIFEWRKSLSVSMSHEHDGSLYSHISVKPLPQQPPIYMSNDSEGLQLSMTKQESSNLVSFDGGITWSETYISTSEI